MTDDLDVGGVQKIVQTLVAQLSTLGVAVGVMASDGGALWADLSPETTLYPVRSRGSGLRSWLEYAWNLRRVVLADRWTIVHAHQRRVALAARLAVLGTDVPVIEHVHSIFPAVGLRRMISFRGHMLIACGSGVARMLSVDFGRKESRILVIKNTVPDMSHGCSFELPSADGRVPKVLGIGRLSEEKDPQMFVKIVEAVHRTGCELRAEWVGDGPLWNEMERVVRSSSANVAMYGATSDVRSRILDADFVLISSKWEGLPLVGLEAMSLGRGLVAPAVGSISDILESGSNGILYRREDGIEAIASAISRSIELGELHEWGVQSRRRFIEHGNVQSMGSQVWSLYKEVERIRGD